MKHMAKNKLLLLLALSLFCLLLIPFATAEVVVFDNYKSTMTYENGKLFVTKELRLKNVGPNPIIPGEIHFKISKDQKGNPVAPVIGNFKVGSANGQELETRQVSTSQEVDLIFTIWEPLLPGFFYDMVMTYELEFDPNGVLFYNVVLPEERTTIPIKKSTTIFKLPKKYRVTYLSPEGEVSPESDATTIEWDIKDSYQVEYSVVPFPRLGIKAVNIFWILIIILFMINLILRMRKKSRMAQSL